MHTLQITEPILDGYKNEKLTDERISFLKAQANEQLEEISQKKEIYEEFLKEINIPDTLDNIVLWILLMSNEDICDEYISEFNKGFRDIIPVSDLADLLLYIVHLKKVQGIDTDGADFLFKYEEEGIEEVDQYAFTNALLYVQKSKEVVMEF